MSKEPKDQHFFVVALVRSKNLEPAVQIELDDIKTQVDAEKAREIALMILEASEAAMSDAFLVKFLLEKTGAPLDSGMGIILGDFRTFRDEQRNKAR